MKRIISALLLLTCIATTLQAKDASKKDLEKLTAHVERLENRIKELEALVDPLEDEMRARARTLKFRQHFEERMMRDKRIYDEKERQELEQLYQTANRQWNTLKAKHNIEILIDKYAKSNRAGCAVLYLGQMSPGTKKRDYFKKAIKNYGDCWYGDGVQVGAYGRFLLAIYYKNEGNNKAADKLFKEVLNKYPDAIDHKGNMLKDAIKDMGRRP